MIENNYVYKKEIDWSVLHQGISIPVTIQVAFQKNIDSFLKRGQTKEVFIMLNGTKYSAKLVNQKFDEIKYGNRKDILQIRYSPGSELACELRKIFYTSYIHIFEARKDQIDKCKKIIKIPDTPMEFLTIYTTPYLDTYYIECINYADSQLIKESIVYEEEAHYENSLNAEITDKSARIDVIQQLTKIRRLSRAIGDNLKQLYSYKCQICGNDFGTAYQANIVEAHHILPFVTSLNNDSTNQIILCPNHHRVIHIAEPIFDRRGMTYKYGNGFVENIILNRHL